MSSCTRCQIRETLKKNNKHDLSNKDINIISRTVYEKLQKKEKSSDNKSSPCVTKMKAHGKSEEASKKICSAIAAKDKSNETEKKKKGMEQQEVMMVDNQPMNVTQEQALGLFEAAFREEIASKYSKVETYADIDRIRDRIWDLEEKRRDMERLYKKVSNEPFPEDTLNIRKAMIRSSMLTTII